MSASVPIHGMRSNTRIIPPTAWIFSQFAAANVASAVLVSSNPTNLVISGAFSIPYFAYSAYMIIPALFSAAFMFLVLFTQFNLISRKRGQRQHLIPSMIVLPESGSANARQFLIDKNGAIIGSTLMVVTLVVLVATSPLKPAIPVWRITMPGAILMFLRDVYHDWRQRPKNLGVSQEPSSPEGGVEMDEIVNPIASPKEESGVQEPSGSKKLSRVPLKKISNLQKDRSIYTLLKALNTHPRTKIPNNVPHHSKPPCCSTPLRVLDVHPRPRARSLWLARYFLRVVEDDREDVRCERCSVRYDDTFVTFMQCACFLFEYSDGLVHLLTDDEIWQVCGTNIGTTILIARVLQLSESQGEATKTRSNPIVYALAFGTNIGAFTFSFSASLAGLLWREILRQKGIHVSRRQFALLNTATWITATIIGSTVLLIQHRVVQ